MKKEKFDIKKMEDILKRIYTWAKLYYDGYEKYNYGKHKENFKLIANLAAEAIKREDLIIK